MVIIMYSHHRVKEVNFELFDGHICCNEAANDLYQVNKEKYTECN